MENYKLRKLKAPDVFLVTTIISKIGVKKFKDAFTNDEVNSMISKKENEQTIGLSIVFELVDIICKNLINCKTEIYELLSRLSNIPTTEFDNMDATLFIDMIVDVIKDNSKDFTKVVSRLL